MWGTMMVNEESEGMRSHQLSLRWNIRNESMNVAENDCSPFFADDSDSNEGSGAGFETLIRNKFMNPIRSSAENIPPPLPSREEDVHGSPGFDTLVHRQFMRSSAGASPSSFSRSVSSPSSSSTSPTSSAVRPVHRKTSTLPCVQSLRGSDEAHLITHAGRLDRWTTNKHGGKGCSSIFIIGGAR